LHDAFTWHCIFIQYWMMEATYTYTYMTLYTGAGYMYIMYDTW